MNTIFSSRMYNSATLIFFVGAVWLVAVGTSSTVCAEHATCGNNHRDGGRGLEQTIVLPPPPPPPLPCVLTTNLPPVIQAGTTTVELSWTPAPSASSLHNTRLFRSGVSLPLSSHLATSHTDTFKARTGSVRYDLQYLAVAGTPGYPTEYWRTCSVTIPVVDTLTECNDGIDNGDNEDGLIDRLDPGCHTDGNPTNPSTHTPTDTSESNPRPDLVTSLRVTATSTLAQNVSVTPTITNQSATYAPLNNYIYGWRNLDATAEAPSCAFLSQCFTHNGNTYRRIGSPFYTYTYTAGQSRSITGSFNPSLPGRYQVCAIADSQGVVVESSETNNVMCKTARVYDVAASVPTFSAPSFTVAPSRVRKGNPATLTWNTGGRVECTITGTNSETISLMGASSASTRDTQPITAETTYTLYCADDETSLSGTVKLLPQFQEV